jgi:hypothetical protein
MVTRRHYPTGHVAIRLIGQFVFYFYLFPKVFPETADQSFNPVVWRTRPG